MGPGDVRRGNSLSRRTLLRASGALFGASLAGCVGNDDSISVLSAGSLAQTFENHIGPAFQNETGITVHGEYYGTNALIRMVEDRTTHPDVIVSADATLLRDRLYDEFTDWDVEFAANSLGIGYNDETTFGQRLEGGEPWYEVAAEVENGDLSIGDPDLDPLGYRAIQAFELAERKHDYSGLRNELTALAHREPDETTMLTGVESGSRSAAIVYRNMAIDRGLPFFEFPDEYNFGNPDLADHYATVAFTTDEEEYTAEGRPILYNVTVNDQAEAPDGGRELVQFLGKNPGLLTGAGLTVGDKLPRLRGTVPDVINL